MTPELTSLTWVAALSAVMWLPYILNLIMVRVLVDAVGYPDDPKPMAAHAGYSVGTYAVVCSRLDSLCRIAGRTTLEKTPAAFRVRPSARFAVPVVSWSH